MENRISSEITQEKIKIMNDIDLNALFNLNYNFDLLKGIIETLLHNQQKLQNQLDDVNKSNSDKDDRISKLEKELKLIKETYVDKDSFDIVKTDLDKIKEQLKEHDGKINNNYENIKELQTNSNEHERRISNLENLLKNTKKEDRPVMPQSNYKDEDIEKIKKDLNDLKLSYEGTVVLVNEINTNYKEKDDNLQKQIDDLKKYIEDNLKDINQKLKDLANSQGKLRAQPIINTGGSGNNYDEIINELKDNIKELEEKLDKFIEKVNVEEIYKQLKYLDENKADKSDVDKDLDKLYKKYKELKEKHSKDIDEINKKIDKLIMSSQSKGGLPITIDNSGLEEHKKQNDEEFKKIWEEISKLKDQIADLLKSRDILKDLEDLKELLLSKIDELAIACNKKFADKNETSQNFKYIEEQLKHILALLKSLKSSDNNADNWLLAKKPIAGFSCASCEAYIGNLRDDRDKFLPWNKMPLRETGDKLYRMGNGFSKMLQMLNFDSNGNISLNPNELNTNNTNDINMNKTNYIPKKDSKNSFKRIQSAGVRGKNAGRKVNQDKVMMPELSEERYKLNDLPKIKGEDFAAGAEEEEGPKITKVFRKSINK